MDFSNSLVDWYLQNKRDLPWRKTQNPYYIWLSEIMLQQTRVAQGLPYYLAFVDAFQTVHDLANAHEEQVLKLWQGLGYYSRARNLHATAQYISRELKGKFPDNYKDLLQLKGVGEYTAAAIASISFDEDVAVVDGNVFRVLARYFGVESDIALAKTKKEFQELANSLLPKGKAAVFNQAIMEFGATQCSPKSPDCSVCPLNSSCFALQKKRVDVLPIKSKKLKVKNRYFNYIVLKDSEGNFLVEKRTAKGIWHNLYEFPLLETETEISIEDAQEQILQQYENATVIFLEQASVIHKLSHQHLNIRFFEVELKSELADAISFDRLLKLPFPIVLHNFITANYSEVF